MGALRDEPPPWRHGGRWAPILAGGWYRVYVNTDGLGDIAEGCRARGQQLRVLHYHDEAGHERTACVLMQLRRDEARRLRRGVARATEEELSASYEWQPDDD